VYSWVCYNNLTDRLKHILNKMVAGVYDVTNECVKKIMVKSVRILLVLALTVSMFSLSAQELFSNTITAIASDSIIGKVKSTENKIYLQNVEVRNKLNETNALTDATGIFMIT
jgi:hypothetical protein